MCFGHGRLEMRKTKTNKASNKWANYIKRIVYLGRVICYILLLFFSANVNSFSPESVADSQKKNWMKIIEAIIQYCILVSSKS